MTQSVSSFSEYRGSIKAINQYKIVRELGSGAFSRVYLAMDKFKEIAIKVIKKNSLRLEGEKCSTVTRETAAL
jgi:serine/threonine protein kinase